MFCPTLSLALLFAWLGLTAKYPQYMLTRPAFFALSVLTVLLVLTCAGVRFGYYQDRDG